MPGVFMMGSPISESERGEEEERQFEAKISQGFWLGQYSVTQAQWQAVFGSNPSHFQQCLDCPVDSVNWHQAINFCQELNKIFGGELPKGYEFSLPTEVHWEYACRAGTITMYHSGQTLIDLSRVAWHKNNSSGHTHPVGEREPNKWELYDMHGNVMEWCFDSPSDYPNAPAIDWIGNGNGFVRNIRGGSWGTPPESVSLGAASRGYIQPDTVRPWFGFRLCIRMVN